MWHIFARLSQRCAHAFSDRKYPLSGCHCCWCRQHRTKWYFGTHENSASDNMRTRKLSWSTRSWFHNNNNNYSNEELRCLTWTHRLTAPNGVCKERKNADPRAKRQRISKSCGDNLILLLICRICPYFACAVSIERVCMSMISAEFQITATATNAGWFIDSATGKTLEWFLWNNKSWKCSLFHVVSISGEGVVSQHHIANAIFTLNSFIYSRKWLQLLKPELTIQNREILITNCQSSIVCENLTLFVHQFSRNEQ